MKLGEIRFKYGWCISCWIYRDEERSEGMWCFLVQNINRCRELIQLVWTDIRAVSEAEIDLFQYVSVQRLQNTRGAGKLVFGTTASALLPLYEHRMSWCAQFVDSFPSFTFPTRWLLTIAYFPNRPFSVNSFPSKSLRTNGPPTFGFP